MDDDAVARIVLEAMVTSLGHECVLAEDGSQAWRLLQDGSVDVVISDRNMPNLDGLELCRRIRQADDAHGYVYIVLASGLREDDQARDGMLAGADDYLFKPVQQAQLERCLIGAQRVTGLHTQLQRVRDELSATARRDPMTGLGNRLQMEEDLVSLADRARRYGHLYCIGVLDVDHFKAYNDHYGHQAGDEALRAIAHVLQTGSRAGDSCYRYGGEEFLYVYPEQAGQPALRAAERTLQAIRALGIPHASAPDRRIVTASMGIAQLSADSPDPHTVLGRADQALYLAKRNGRCQAALWDEHSVPA